MPRGVKRTESQVLQNEISAMEDKLQSKEQEIKKLKQGLTAAKKKLTKIQAEELAAHASARGLTLDDVKALIDKSKK